MPALVSGIKSIMESILPLSETKGVPLAVAVSSGDNWGEVEKLTANN